jgi:hypothetical protein
MVETVEKLKTGTFHQPFRGFDTELHLCSSSCTVAVELDDSLVRLFPSLHLLHLTGLRTS